MEVKYKRLKRYLFYLFLLSCLLFTSGFMILIRYDGGKDIYNHLSYGIGVYTGQNNVGMYGSKRYKFDFNVNGIQYNHVSSIASVPNSAEINHKYLVVYDSTDVKKAAILYSYPIKDSLQFEQYMEEFKKKSLNITPFFRPNYLRNILKDYSRDNSK